MACYIVLVEDKVSSSHPPQPKKKEEKKKLCVFNQIWWGRGDRAFSRTDQCLFLFSFYILAGVRFVVGSLSSFYYTEMQHHDQWKDLH